MVRCTVVQSVVLRVHVVCLSLTFARIRSTYVGNWRQGGVGVSRDCPIFWIPPIISGTGKAKKFKFCTHIHRIPRNKSPLKISGKVTVCVLRDSRKFSGHAPIYRAHRAVIFAIARLSCWLRQNSANVNKTWLNVAQHLSNAFKNEEQFVLLIDQVLKKATMKAAVGYHSGTLAYADDIGLITRSTK